MSFSDCLISCCLIVKNEAKNLSRCLDSVKSVADELIVVDTGSEDETVAIAHKYGAKVYHFEWCNDFAAARNFAISKARGSWILMPDADEQLIFHNLNVREHVQDCPVEILAVQIPILSAEGSVTQMLSPRLFRNLPSIQYVGQYHEALTLEQRPLQKSALTAFSGLEIIHYGYHIDILPQKSHQRIPMLEEIRQNQGLDFMLLWTLTAMYECTQQMDKVQDCYEEAMERLMPNLLSGSCPEDTRSLRSWLFGLGKMALEHEDLETLRYLCWRGTEWFPDFPPLQFLAGLMIKQLGFHLGAIPYFQKCLEFGQAGQYFKGEPFHPNLLTLMPAYELALSYEELSHPRKAVECWQLCLKFDNEFQPAKAKLSNMIHSDLKS